MRRLRRATLTSAKQVHKRLVRQINVFGVVALVRVEHTPHVAWVPDDDARLCVARLRLVWGMRGGCCHCHRRHLVRR